MKPVGIGVIGCGVIGRMHVRSASRVSSAKVVAIADVRADVAQTLAREFSVPKVYSNAADLLNNPDVEGVVLALPAIHRLELALQVFAHGKHLLNEKPIGRNAGEVRQMIERRGALVAGCTSSRFRQLPSAKVASDVIRSGELGELRLLRCRGIRPAGPPPASLPPAWRLSRELNGGGILANWGCYDLDFLLGITGWSVRPRSVMAKSWGIPDVYSSHVPPNQDAETHVSAFIECEGDVAVTLERGEYVSAPAETSWEVIGSKGSLRLTMIPSQEKQIVQYTGSASAGVEPKTIWSGSDDWEMIHTGVLDDFALAVRNGTSPMTTLEQALVVQRIVDGVYTSSERGTAVPLG